MNFSIVEVGVIREIMVKQEISSISAQLQSSSDTYTTMITRKRILNLMDKEACGVPLLAVFAAELAGNLAQAMNKKIKADMEFPAECI